MPPATNTQIAQRYTSKTLEKKSRNKTAFQEELGWPAEPKRPVLCIPTGLSDKLGGALFEEILPGMLTLPMEILIVGKGSSKYGQLCTELAATHTHRIAIISNDEASLQKMYAAADVALFLSDSTGMTEVEECLSYGVVPVAPSTNSLDDYNPIQETGNAFLYEGSTHWHTFGALVRAMETFKFPFDWRTIQRHCMEGRE